MKTPNHIGNLAPTIEGLQAQIASLTAENERLREALTDVEPYLDAIVCYASTMGEHEGNRIAAAVRSALQPKEETK